MYTESLEPLESSTLYFRLGGVVGDGTTKPLGLGEVRRHNTVGVPVTRRIVPLTPGSESCNVGLEGPVLSDPLLPSFLPLWVS